MVHARISAKRDAEPPTGTTPVVIDSGNYQGTAWYLLAYEADGKLCMFVRPSASLSADASGGSAGFNGGQCSFYSGDGVTYYFSANGPGNAWLDFGPLPSQATQIRVASRQTLAATVLPPGKGLPAGRFWVHLAPPGWPLSTEGAALTTPQPLNAQGQPVTFQTF